jgi:hypothetical protein
MDINWHVVAIDDDGMYTEICDTEQLAIEFAIAMIDADDELKDCEELTIIDSDIFLCQTEEG